jgi:hypothetical protein
LIASHQTADGSRLRPPDDGTGRLMAPSFDNA